MKKIMAVALSTCLVASTWAQKDGKKNIDKLCGCFDVSFKYAETFSPNKDYKFHDRESITNVTELALPIVNTAKKVVIQHLLVIDDTTIVKHWREDWTYEDPTIWIFKGDGLWEKTTVPAANVKGKWTQTVWEVSDAPRYQGASVWQDVNSHTIWENTTDAPLPRREYTTRSDYNILQRTNRLVLLPNGYNHVQDNVKISRTATGDSIRAEEKGLNGYILQPESKCQPGVKYWKDYSPFWVKVESVWEKYMNEHTQVKLVESLGKGKTLNSQLFRLAEEWKKGKVSGNIDEVIGTTILEHLK
ncbi:MAG: hypothetical protein DI598_03245 [Pseudopedobacter saltans]|uniref:Uncharacterized protein n=1 Tax=Pseudopedobacter saltans TaxID=151895 RepID=A0A2W5FCR3_9SPHI|nr:MAG: hypothetical protein DI598_03245 [Pseudopedobacter saltans]